MGTREGFSSRVKNVRVKERKAEVSNQWYRGSVKLKQENLDSEREWKQGQKMMMGELCKRKDNYRRDLGVI